MADGGQLTFLPRMDDVSEEQDAGAGGLTSFFGKWWSKPEVSASPVSAPPPIAHLSAEAQPPTSSNDAAQSDNLSSSDTSSLNLVIDETQIPRSKAKKLAALFRKERSGLIDYEKSMFKQYWMPDSAGRECYLCEEKFTTFRRRHHCRLCGQIFCAKCCSVNIAGASLGYLGDLRLCTYCAAKVDEHLAEDDQKSPDLLVAPQPILLASPVKGDLETPGPTNSYEVATVSNATLLWSGKKELSPEKKDSLSLPPPSYKPPAMLSVEGLFSVQDNPKLMNSENSSRVNLSDEDEGATVPEWVKNMELAESGHALKSIENSLSQKPNEAVHFDLGSLAVESLDDQQIPKEPVMKKDSLNKKSSLSPEVPEFINENDVDKLFDHQAEMLVDYLFQREGLCKERWRDIVLNQARLIPSKVIVDVFNRRDMMNILQYVHIKTLPTDEPPKAETIWGVACSNSVTHSSMCGELTNASVMLISAAELLKAAGLRLVVGVKKEVLARIARATGAEIVPGGEAQLQQNQNVGFCPLFVQREIRRGDGSTQFVLVFDQCPPDRGCSLLLQGGTKDELRSVKKILKFLILNFYSSKLERAFLAMNDCKLAYTLSNCPACENRRENIEATDPENDFLTALHQSVLSSSPYIEFEPPFLETPRGKESALLPYFKQPLYHFGANCSRAVSEVRRKEPEHLKSPYKPVFATTSPASPNYASKVAAFRALSSVLFQKKLDRQSKGSLTSTPADSLHTLGLQAKEDVFDPFVHQRIAILFGSYSPKSPNAPLLCVRPWVVSMQFYATNDMTLGEFLTKFCFNKDYQCPSTNCELSMMEHSRKMVYGRICVEVTTTNLQHGLLSDGSAEEKRIASYHYCEECRASSPIVYMDVATWHLSFARFLDYLANASFSQGTIKTPSGNVCNHCYFHQQSHFFSFNNYVTNFKVSTIMPYHVQFSPIVCNINNAQISTKSLAEMLTRTIALSQSICAQGNERLDNFCQTEKSMQIAGQFYNTLKELLDGSQKTIGELFDSVKHLCEQEDRLVSSMSDEAIQTNDILIHMRAEIYGRIQLWNEQCSVLSASVRAMKRGEELVPGAEDGAGAYKPDIGSIIAYALASNEYEDGRAKSRDAMGDADIPLNLSARSNADDEDISLGEHVEVEFQDSQASYYVKGYYAERFRLLRKLLFPKGEEGFIRSLSTSNYWTPQGGKSGAFFYRTNDQRFVIKQMSKFEVQSFVKFAPRYFEYIKTAALEKKLTTLCKVYGVFRIGYRHKTSGVQIKADILVMEYLFYKKNVSKVWDLKGSLRNRFANTKSSSDLVLMDENFIKDLWNSQLYVYPHSKAALNQAISNDSHFLSAQHVMDYSLLVGVDDATGELILGIVDYMRTYTLDKKVESWVKIVAVPGAHLPTVISPQLYCTRFSEAIDTYFPVVPDQWTGLGSTMSY
ncbi:unnamed protein product, partial [Mesorhabditis spiculigera]